MPAYVDTTPAQRVAEVGVLLRGTAAVTGWGALTWRGARWFDGLTVDGTPLPVPVVAPTRRLRPQPCLELHEERLPATDVECRDGLRVTTALRSVVSVLRHAGDLDAAVSALEMAYCNDLVSPDEVAGWLAAHPGVPGVVQARAALDLADQNSWSPMEWTLRRLWTERFGSARLLTNRPVFDHSGRHVATPDVIDADTGVSGEYDGVAHHGGARRAKDLRREADLRRVGVEPVVMVAADAHRRTAFWARLEDAYARARRTSASDRAWTLEPPHWWRSTHTVDLRRSLEGTEREVWLGGRSARPSS
ncbi:hypothetical protein I601_1709 [Nocardioides dokdonensis FR1436]|uniref:AbiEi antitoxin C-terminal domain-containing protein n=1 Tax=Nocardioides dokdonensis FR1436 TaxID=1300347 RepID=A0A1A9GKE0_9ACTN|nr:hypothetical protein [Nocardioides dokdonensis]ANH38140.1 hypothetical protein I601_1709 [Nocardioides dokdonensis FR1436]